MKRQKKIVHCFYCPARILRVLDMPRNECDKCKAKRRAKWAKDHPEVWKRANIRWRKANAEHVKEASRQWRKDNPETAKEIGRRAWKKYRAELESIVEEVSAICECGARHTFEQRARVLRRMLSVGASAHEIREEWSCIWGSPDVQDAGARRLYRDLERLGAIRDGGTYYMPSESRAA